MLFCADLKKFQKLKEIPYLKKEENDETEIRIAGKKTKFKEEDNKPVKSEAKSARHKKAKMSA